MGGYPPVAPRSTGVAGGHAGADILDTPLALRDIEPEDAASRMLRTLQANILHPHVRTHLRVVALRIDEPFAARRALARVGTHLKSAADQFDELNAYRSSGEPGSAYAGVGISASGYERLGVDPGEWPADPAFRSGMRQRNLGDPDPQRWESGYRELIDALVVVGSHSKKLTARKVREVMKVLGGSEDGMPVALQSADGMHHPVPNNFTYEGDPAGARCPYAGHIRRLNARPEAIGARTVIARRGQGYGVRKDDPSDDDLSRKPKRGVGLLFMAVVARIEDQFEALQLTANGDVDGVFDPVMGQVRDPDAKPPVSLPATWGGPAAGEKVVAVKPSVTLRGGEYFFLPSIGSLIRLGKG